MHGRPSVAGAGLKNARRAVSAAALLLLGWFAAPATPAVTPQEPAEETPARRGGPSLPRGKKLILNDGSYQLVREYQRDGRRVRYYSVERSKWEELPAELVDWEATKRAETQAAARQAELEKAAEEARANRLASQLDVDASIEVAPGVFLPDGEGAFAIEGASIHPLVQNLVEVRIDKGRILTQILIPLPTVPTRHRVELKGARAEIRLTAEYPEFYMRTADQREPRMELVRAEVSKGRRLIEAVDTNIAQEQWRDRNTIPLTLWQVARGVYRFTLLEPLPPGEYALIELLPDNQPNAYVWDFGVDRSAPASEKKKQ